MSSWGGARLKPPPGDGPNPWWGTPSSDSNPWQSPGHGRAFRDTRSPDVDPVGRGFTTRKKHGWWGREEYFDEDGNKI